LLSGESRGNAPEVPEFVETSLDRIPDFTGLKVIGDLLLRAGLQGIGIICLICQHPVWGQTPGQSGSYRVIPTLTMHQDQWIA